MLARTAENLYWMTRYLERAENTARLINSTTHVLLDIPHVALFDWTNLVEIVGLDDHFHQYYPDANEDAVMRFLIEDERNPSSILSCVQFARENTRTLREILPAEMWEQINSLFHYVRENATLACNSRRNRYMILNNIIEQRQAIIGLFSGAMGRDLAYQLIKLGRNVDRADMTTRILDLHSAIEWPQDGPLQEMLQERLWMSTLNTLSGYQTYRRLVGMQVKSHDVIDFLLKNIHFPRSVDFCLSEIESCLKLMPRSQYPLQIVAVLRHKLQQHYNDGLNPIALHEYLDQLQAEIGAINDLLTEHYFHAYQGDVSEAIPPDVMKSAQ
jgi:uncharacterized alpha-E superfamily protein